MTNLMTKIVYMSSKILNHKKVIVEKCRKKIYQPFEIYKRLTFIGI